MAIVKDIDITPEQQETVCAILATHFPDVEVWAYGSRVHWNATPSSDLDLVAFSSDKSGLANCREAFAESSLPFRVDLFLWDEIPVNFQDRIKKEYAVIQAGEWKKVKLKDIGYIITGKTPSTKDKENFGEEVPFITPADLQDGKYIVSTERYLSEKGAEVVKKNNIPLNSICVSCIGNIGYVAMSSAEKNVTNQQINSIIPNKNYDSDFVYYLLKSMKPLFKSFEGQSTTLSILNKSQFSEIEAFVPQNMVEQKRIAGILSAFDDKIELNRKMCKTLEAMAEALFKSWFVDFEPVRAKIDALENGKDPELAAMMSISGNTESDLAELKTSHPAAYADLAHTASLFPSVMVESEQGKIPEEWQAVQLKDVTIQITARIGEKKCKVLSAVSSGELVLSEEHFNKQVFSKETNKYILVKPNAYAYNPSRINIGSLGRNKFDFAGCVSPIYVVFSVAEEYISFFDQFFASQIFKDEVLLRASGSVRQALNYSEFGQIALQYPPLPIIQAFNAKIDIVLQKLSALSAENQTLSSLRDNHLTEFFSIQENRHE